MHFNPKKQLLKLEIFYWSQALKCKYGWMCSLIGGFYKWARSIRWVHTIIFKGSRLRGCVRPNLWGCVVHFLKTSQSIWSKTAWFHRSISKRCITIYHVSLKPYYGSNVLKMDLSCSSTHTVDRAILSLSLSGDNIWKFYDTKPGISDHCVSTLHLEQADNIHNPRVVLAELLEKIDGWSLIRIDLRQNRKPWIS